MRRAFTLIELLVVLAIIALLLGLALPALAKARESGRGVVCLSNLRGVMTITQQYADTYRGLSPALGQPYTAVPNWAVLVQQSAGVPGTTASETLTGRSVLVCPSANALYGRTMTRTYAINATGHAGMAQDRGNYDDPGTDPDAPHTEHIRLDLIQFPSLTPAFVDASAASVSGNAPPPTRCASVIDYRDSVHVPSRLGFFHAGRGAFSVAAFDTSTKIEKSVQPSWRDPLP